MEETENFFAEWCREQGKVKFYDHADDEAARAEGIKYLIKAYMMGDAEASFIVANLMRNRIVMPVKGDPEEVALQIYQRLANSGYNKARVLLDGICDFKYRRSECGKTRCSNYGELTDFDGKIIKINRKGALMPIKAELKYVDGKNILRLTADISICCADDEIDVDTVFDAVLDGISDWEGEYTVFGGQYVKVEIHLREKAKFFGSVNVITLTETIGEMAQKVSNAVGTKTRKERVNDMLRNKRSFAIAGIKKWSVMSNKIIYIQSDDNSFTDYEEMRAVAKHEFGHALGLGDLYYSTSDKYPGVEKGTYPELDCFYIKDKEYNLVMCDHHGPISNNDIEMVILAFRENRMQLYQKVWRRDKISKALGRGN